MHTLQATQATAQYVKLLQKQRLMELATNLLPILQNSNTSIKVQWFTWHYRRQSLSLL